MLKKELLEFFLTEAEELIGQLENGFLELEQNPSDMTGINDLFRNAHTLKGSAALVKLNTLSAIAHRMEDVLESVRDNQIPANKEIVDWFLLSLDAIKFLVSETVHGRPEKTDLIHEICSALPSDVSEYFESKEPEIEKEAGATEEASVTMGENSKDEKIASDDDIDPWDEDLEKETVQIDEHSGEEHRSTTSRTDELSTMSSFVKVHVNDLEKMMGLVGDLTIFKNLFLSEIDGARQFKNEIQYASRRLLKEIHDFRTSDAHSAPETISYIDPLLEEFRELEFDRYDGMALFANRVNEITSDIDEALKSISSFFDQFSKHAIRLDKLNLQFRDLISASRMVETGKLFQRFSRIVRDLSDHSGKKVNFVVRGGQTRIDKVLYERLFTPLLHLIRNAFSHGIEPMDVRRTCGKPEEGKIVLSAKRDGNSVLIDIQDDGKGINLNNIYQKAVQSGIIKDGLDMSQAQILNILFMPGFSTTDDIDMTSGRGVGLDAARKMLSEINGTMSIATKEGKGSIFRIRLPLTLIVVNTVKFKTGGLEFSVPSGIIQELIDIDTSEYDRDRECIKLGNEEKPVKNLCNLLNLNPVSSGKKVSAIVFNIMSGKENAIIVDEITGMEDSVIKPLGGFLKGLTYCAGVSISADGKLVPVINPLGLLGIQNENMALHHEPAVKESNNNVLIVDDSLSVRKIAGMILEQQGYNVITAQNGHEALNLLEEKHVDFILTDLEMPVMHGYELLRELKRRGISEVIPVVVLTSRSNDKHREKAASLGARDYIVKPFEEETLTDTVRKHIKSTHAVAGP